MLHPHQGITEPALAATCLPNLEGAYAICPTSAWEGGMLISLFYMMGIVCWLGIVEQLGKFLCAGALLLCERAGRQITLI